MQKREDEDFYRFEFQHTVVGLSATLSSASLSVWEEVCPSGFCLSCAVNLLFGMLYGYQTGESELRIMHAAPGETEAGGRREKFN